MDKNIFKEIFNQVKRRVKLTGDFDSKRFCLSVNLGNKDDNDNERTFFTIDVFGADNLVGGTLVTVLSNHTGEFLVPKLRDDAMISVFLNGLFHSSDPRCPLTLMTAIADMESKIFCNTPVSVRLKDYDLSYYYMTPDKMKECVNQANGNFDTDLFVDIISDIVAVKLLPDYGSIFMWAPTPKTINTAIVKCIIGNDYYSEDIRNYNADKFEVLSKYVSRYIYHWLIRDIEKEASSIVSRQVMDIPIDADDQRRYLEKLKKSLDGKKWKAFEDKFVFER